MEVLVQEICNPANNNISEPAVTPSQSANQDPPIPCKTPGIPKKENRKKKGKQELVLTPGLLADLGVEAGTHGDREEGFVPRTRRLRRRGGERSPAKCGGGVGFGGRGERGGRGISYYKRRGRGPRWMAPVARWTAWISPLRAMSFS